MDINCRNLLGEDLDSLGIKELESLEKQLDSSLKHIRSTRVMHRSDYLGVPYLIYVACFKNVSMYCHSIPSMALANLGSSHLSVLLKKRKHNE
jgi:hypothetical protein